MKDCTSCDELRSSAPLFVLTGLTDKMRNNLADNKGYENSGNEDCEDLNLANDCLLGRMPSALNAYDDCDWKTWAKEFSNNVYQMMGSTIAAICGLWGMNVSAKAFVNHIRDYGTGGDAYFQSFDYHDSHTQSYYMNAKHASYGSKVADRDYIVLISHCFNIRNVKEFDGVVTWYSSGDSRDISDIRAETGQHPTLLTHSGGDGIAIDDCSWTLSTAIAVKKGEYVKSNIYCVKSTALSGESAIARIHQIAMTWIPATIGTED